MSNTYACIIGVSNPNVPIFPPRVCTLVLCIILLFAIIIKFCIILLYAASVLGSIDHSLPDENCTNLLLLLIYLFVIIIIIILLLLVIYYILLSLDLFHSLIIIFLCFSISRYIHLLLY